MQWMRALAFNLFFYTATPAIAVIAMAQRFFGNDRSLSWAQAWAHVMVPALQRICGIDVQVTGAEHLPADGPALLASQHQSAFDTIIWFTLVRRPSYIVKRELTRIPVFGTLLQPAGMIPVDRQAGAMALRSLVQATLAAREEARQIVIFPEGTRVAPGVRVPLQPGVAAIAARLALPVIPVATDSGLRWGRRAFRKAPGVIHIAIGPPIPSGTPRAELLAGIEAYWRQQERAGFRPVDNSVESYVAEPLESLNPSPQSL